MPIIDIDMDKIINGTDQKRMLNQYKLMKENYTDGSALDFSNTYKDKPLSFITENSRMIFSEPYWGYDFYKESVLLASNCDFIGLENECEKIRSYVEEVEGKVPEKQKKMYDELLETAESLVENTKNVRVVSESIEDSYPGITKTISDAIYANDPTAFMEAMGEDDSLYHAVIEAYSPYIALKKNSDFLYQITERFARDVESESDILESADNFQRYAIRSVSGNKASCDKLYQEGLTYMPRDIRMLVDYLAKENLYDALESVRTVDEPLVTYASPQLAVNSLFTDMEEAEVFSEEYNAEKARYDEFTSIASEATMVILGNDYAAESTEDPIPLVGYSIFQKTDMSYTEAVDMLAAYVPNEGNDFFVEAGGQNKDATAEDDDDKTPNDGNLRNNGKIEKPPKQDLPTRIQNKAMDMQVAQQKKFGELKRAGVKVANAAKAVAALPMDIANSIKDIAHKLDDADDARRKKYMTEPGFRKKIFRNMKLSLLYASALSTRLSLFPVVLVARHASKQKDRRIRNECFRELRTEIRICEEKINDANTAGDNKEKYRLMRIRDQLEAEAIRVRTNSKAI